METVPFRIAEDERHKWTITVGCPDAGMALFGWASKEAALEEIARVKAGMARGESLGQLLRYSP